MPHICCDPHHELSRVTKKKKHTKPYKRIRALYFRETPRMYRAVRTWLKLTHDALMYGVTEQMIHGKTPLPETIDPYRKWKPKTKLQKAQLDLSVELFLKALNPVAVVPQYQKPYSSVVNNQVKVLGNWNCIRMKGERAIGNHHLRIYGKAMNTAGQIARISTSWDVVNERAVAWAAKHSAKLVTVVTEGTKTALREVISKGIADGKSMYTIGRRIREIDAVGLNVPQAKSLMKLEGRLAATKMTPKNQTKALQRRARKMRRYRAEMIARTETADAMSAGTIEGYKEAGVRRRRFEATGDACAECSWRDGSVYEIGESEGLIPVHPNCFTSLHVPIYTADGWKRIGDIVVGDLVLTHKGRFRKVSELHRQRSQTPNVVCLSILGGGGQYQLKVTEGHPVFVEDCWVAAKDVRVGQTIAALSHPCPACGSPLPWNKKFCNPSCHMKHGYASGEYDPMKATSVARAKLRELGKQGKHPLQLHPERCALILPRSRKKMVEKLGTKEVREKMSASKMGKKNPMHKTKHDEAYWHQVSERMKQSIKDDPTAYLNFRKASDEYWANPENCKRLSQKKTAFYAKHPEKHLNAYVRRMGGDRNGSMTGIERSMGKELRSRGLQPEYNYHVGRFWIDWAFPEQKLGIECDGKWWHQDKEKDKRRDEKLAKGGWQMLHFQDDAINEDVGACADKVCRVLANHTGQFEFSPFMVTGVRLYKQQKPTKLYNLSVEEDESYVAKGFVVHNCRCVWVPLMSSQVKPEARPVKEPKVKPKPKPEVKPEPKPVARPQRKPKPKPPERPEKIPAAKPTPEKPKAPEDIRGAAADRARKLLGKDAVASFKGMDAGYAQEVANKFAELKKTFKINPRLRGIMTKSGMKDYSGNVVQGQYFPKAKAITLNGDVVSPKGLKDLARFQAEDFKNKFKSGGKAIDLFTHEYGHALHEGMTKAKQTMFRGMFDDIAFAPGGEKKLIKMTSRYGAKNRLEFFAEATVKVSNGTASPELLEMFKKLGVI